MTPEHLLRDIPMILRIRMRVQIEGQAHCHAAFDEKFVVLINDFCGVNAFLFRLQRDWRAVRVGSADH